MGGMTPCPDCDGTGEAWVEREIYHRQSFNIDSGHVETRSELQACPDCNGTGKIEESDDE